MKKIILILLTACSLFAQKRLNVEIDYSRFHFDDSTGYLEIYYAFHQNELQPVKVNDTWRVNGIINVEIKEKETGKILINKSWQTVSTLDTIANLPNKLLNGVLSFQLDFNNYVCTLKAIDGNNIVNKDSLILEIKIAPIPGIRTSMSDIQLATNIKQSDRNSDSFFIKNNYEVIPNPGLLYGENYLPVLYFYSQLYNLDKFAQANFIKVKYNLFNNSNEKVFEKVKFISTTNKSIVDVGAINILKYISGAYKLRIELMDTVSNSFVYNEKRFFIYNPSVKDTVAGNNKNAQLLDTEFSIMSLEELDNYFQYSKYIASNPEIDEWKTLKSESTKQNFLKKFWNKRNKENNSANKNFQADYFKKIESANARFSTFQKKGWSTDRGRVYIIYGEPTEILRNPSEPDYKPYETWKYDDLEGGVIFVFAELEGFGDYTLLHSTKRGELKDEYWERKVRTK
jgi:GWxTD domain-containing protein